MSLTTFGSEIRTVKGALMVFSGLTLLTLFS